MKRLLTIALAVFGFPVSAAIPNLLSAKYIPDAMFRAYCKEQTAWDIDGDGCLSTAEAAAVTKINVYGKSIRSMRGLEWFTGLTELYCMGNRLTALDISKNTILTELDCWGNRLTSLDVSGCVALTELWCSGNLLTALDVSKNTALTELHCGDNRFTTLDISNNTALTDLDCFLNKLTSLDVSRCVALTRLSCSYNRLTALDISNNTKLETFKCHHNPGDGESTLPVKAWFDDDAVPEKFTKSWTSGRKTIVSVYSTQ